MTQTRVSLCPQCDACPDVVIDGTSVTIGEAGNQARLRADEWNVLVRAVRAGELREVDDAPAPRDARDASAGPSAPARACCSRG